MIIDEILDFKDGYKEKIDLNYIYDMAISCKMDYIITALENGSNKDIQNALCKYIDDNEYNQTIKDFINKIIFRHRNTKKTCYWIANDSWGQHGTDIEELKLNDLQYNRIKKTRNYNNRTGFITQNYISALYYTED